jgi:hypothetical protein
MKYLKRLSLSWLVTGDPAELGTKQKVESTAISSIGLGFKLWWLEKIFGYRTHQEPYVKNRMWHCVSHK